MRSSYKTSAPTSQININAHDPDADKNLPYLPKEQDSKTNFSQPEAFKKLKKYIINSPQNVHTDNQMIERRIHHSGLMKSFSHANVSFFQKSRSPSKKFYLPPQEIFPVRKASQGEDSREHSRYKIRKSNIHPDAMQPKLSSRHKVQVSHFLFEPIVGNETLDLEGASVEHFKSPKNLSIGRTVSRHTTAHTESTSGLPINKVTNDSGLSSLFKSKLNITTQEHSEMKLRRIESLGPFKKQLKYEPGLHQVQTKTTTSSSELLKTSIEPVVRDKKYWFKLKSDICTRNRLNIKSYEKSKTKEARTYTYEEIIRENKDNIMVCVDTEEKLVDKLQYCFVKKEIDKEKVEKIRKGESKAEIEFKMKIYEIQRKLKLSSHYKYLYLLDGSSVFELNMIPSQENVLVISRQKELGSIDDILQNELVSEFYEYGTRKDVAIYSRNHLESKMLSMLETKQEMEQKYNEVLKVLDGDNEEQLNSDELAFLVDSTKNEKPNEISFKINKIFSKRESVLVSRDSEKSWSLDRRKIIQSNSVNTSRVKAENSDQERTIRIKKYVNDKEKLIKTDKLKAYKDIMKYYKNLKGTKVDPQEPDEKLINAAEGDENDEEIVQSTKDSLNVPKNLDVLLSKLRNSRKKMDYLDIKKELEKSRAEKYSESPQKPKEVEFAPQQEKLLHPEDESAKQKRDFIHKNVKNLNTKKGDVEKLHQYNRELSSQNIPKFIKDKKLSRRELHVVYILYKALCEVTSQRHKNYNPEDGIDYFCFRNGIYQVFLQSDDLAEKVFHKIDYNFSGYLNWEEFLNAMVIIRAKTMHDKIDLFIKIADEDGNGQLSKSEIFNLAKMCLGKYITDTDDGFLNDLCEYFTKLIFNSVGITDLNQEIPLQAIKDAILSVILKYFKNLKCDSKVKSLIY